MPRVHRRVSVGLVAALLLAAGCVHPDPAGDVITREIPREWDGDDVWDRVQVYQQTGQATEETEIHFVDEDTGELLWFYRAGMLHRRTDRPFGAVAEVYLEGDLDLARLRGKRVLDLGCGNGAFVADLRALGVEADGIDLFLAEEKLAAPFLYGGDITDMPFENETYDVFFSTWVLSKGEFFDVGFIQGAMREVIRVARPGGRLFITPIEISEAELERILAPFGQLRIEDFSELPGRRGNHRLLLEIRK